MSEFPPHNEPAAIDLRALVAQAAGQGPLWTHDGEDLNVNVLVWPQDAGVGEHINSEVEVLIIGVEGEGLVRIDGEDHEVRPGILLIIPKGARRTIQSQSARFSYVSVHRRRAGLRPTPRV